MKNATTLAGMDAWLSHSVDFPIQRMTGLDVKRPRGKAAAAIGEFLAMPIPELGVIFWGFRNQQDVAFFEANYPVIRTEARGQ